MSPRSLRVSKLHGAGNDFLATVGTADHGPDAGVAARLCDRHRGIGADGLVTLLPAPDATLLAFGAADGLHAGWILDR